MRFQQTECQWKKVYKMYPWGKESDDFRNLRRSKDAIGIADLARPTGRAMLAPHSRDRYSGILVSSRRQSANRRCEVEPGWRNWHTQRT